MTPSITPFLATAVCCREWQVDPLSPIGRCGFCGERPTIRRWHGRAPAVTVAEAEAAMTPTEETE